MVNEVSDLAWYIQATCCRGSNHQESEEKEHMVRVHFDPASFSFPALGGGDLDFDESLPPLVFADAFDFAAGGAFGADRSGSFPWVSELADAPVSFTSFGPSSVVGLLESSSRPLLFAPVASIIFPVSPSLEVVT